MKVMYWREVIKNVAAISFTLRAPLCGGSLTRHTKIKQTFADAQTQALLETFTDAVELK